MSGDCEEELVVNLELNINSKCNPSSCKIVLGIMKIGMPPILYGPFFATWTCHYLFLFFEMGLQL